MSKAYINFIGAREGVKWTGIPTKGGGEMVPFLLGGKVDFAWSGGVHNRYGDDMKVLASMNSGARASSTRSRSRRARPSSSARRGPCAGSARPSS
jgi:hypothetical protein